DYVSAADNASLDLTGNVTFEAWVFVKGPNALNSAQSIIDKTETGDLANYRPYLFNNNMNFWNGSTIAGAGTNPLPTGTWSHVAWVLESGTMTYYLNGSPNGSASTNLGAVNNGQLFIGRDNFGAGNGRYANMIIDEVRIWNDARTNSEITTNSAIELAGTEQGLVAYYPMNHGVTCCNNPTVTTASDRTGTNDGILQNFALSNTSCVSNWNVGAPFASPNSLVNDYTNTCDASGTYPVGTTVVTWTATDGGGQTATCTQNITVVNGSPVAEVQKITASDAKPTDGFSSVYGEGISISSDYAIAGVPNHDYDAAGNFFAAYTGAAYIYERDPAGNWNEVQKLVASDKAGGMLFGSEVDISGNYAIVGSNLEGAYVFERNGSGVWVEVAKLLAFDGVVGDNFGFSVSIDGDVIAVGSKFDDNANGVDAGSVYIFRRNGGGSWIFEQKILPTGGLPQRAGESVAVSGNNLVVGSPGDGIFFNPSGGAVYFYEFNGVSWTQTQIFGASNSFNGSLFGMGVDISGEYAIARNGFYSVNIIERNTSGIWVEKNVININGTSTVRHGISISNNFAAIGQPIDFGDSPNDYGAAYIYSRDAGGTWNQVQKITASDRAPADYFGSSIAIDNGRVVVGAVSEDAGGGPGLTGAGSAYIFEFIPMELVASTTDDDCGNNGTIDLTVSGGIPPYTYSWSNMQTTQDLTGLAIGTYIVTVTDFCGSTASISVAVGGTLDTDDPSISCPPDISVNNDPGKCEADVVIGLPTVTDNCGVLGTALNFDGSNEYVDPNALPPVSDNFTMEMWVNPVAPHDIDAEATSGVTGTNQNYALFPTHGVGWGFNHAGAGISVGTNGISVYEHDNSYLTSLLTYSASISGWTHISVVYINKQPRLYVNGILVKTGLTSLKTAVHPSAGNAGVFTGQFGGVGGGTYGNFIGDIDEVRIWNFSRSQSQIQGDYQSILAGSETGLILYYDLEDGTGSTTANDASPSGYTGTLNNMDPNTDWIQPGAPLSGLLTLTNSFNGTSNASGTYPVGTTPIIWTVTDASGNSETCSMNVTVNDVTPPTLSCQNTTVSLDGNGNAAIETSDVDGGSSDNCVVSLLLDKTDFTCSDIGSNTVTLTATDVAGFYYDSGNDFDNLFSSSLALGDLDGDGDLDAFISELNLSTGNTVWLNDGSGNFSNSGQSLGTAWSRDVELGDLDGDGDLDAFVTNHFSSGDPDQVWINNGSGVFTAGAALGNDASESVSLGDLDGDGDLDAYVAVRNSSDVVWLNDGSANFANSGQTLHTGNSFDVGLGDFDGDNDLDAFIAVNNQPNVVWLNNGSGLFTNSGQSLGLSQSNSVSIGDVDGDGSLDAFVTNGAQLDRIWLNNGSGIFTLSGQSLAHSGYSNSAALGDIDEDGDLDVIIAISSASDAQLWFNDGSGSFTLSPIGLDNFSYHVELGDLDGNKSLDAVFADNGLNSIWLNQANIVSCTADVNVIDNTPPIAICNDLTITLDNTGNASINASQVDNSSTDNCGVATTSLDVTSFDCSDAVASLDQFNYNETSTTNGNNGAAQTFIPSVSGILESVSINMLGIQTRTLAIYDGPPTTGTVISTQVITTVHGLHKYTLTTQPSLTAGNTYSIVIERPPGGGVAVSARYGGDGYTNGVGWRAFNLGVWGQLVLGQDLVFETFIKSDPTVTLTVTDINGNSNTCTSAITVQDTETPVAICPASIADVVLNASGNGTLAADIGDGSSTDNCSVTETSPSVLHTCADLGSKTVTLTATDPSGNMHSTTCSYNVVDHEDPTPICASIPDLILDGNGQATLAANAAEGGSTDNCGVQSASSPAVSFNCSNVGSNSITLTVTDVNSNSATASCSYNVLDNEDPTPVCSSIPDVVLDGNGQATLAANAAEGGSTDNCGVQSATSPAVSLNCSNVGSNSITLTVTDVNSNSATTSCSYNVVDNEDPTPVCASIPDVILDGNGQATLAANAAEGGSMDNCGVQSATSPAVSLNCSNVGSNSITLSVADVNSNSATASCSYNVVDNEDPTPVCSSIPDVILDGNGQATLAADAAEGGSTDNCGVQSATSPAVSLNCSNVGSNSVTLSVTDVNSNSATASCTYNVVDNEDPTPVCASIPDVILDGSGQATLAANAAEGGSTDNCAVQSATSPAVSLNCSNVGSNSVTLTVTDVNANTATASCSYNVVDNQAPNAVCQNINLDISQTFNPALIDGGSTDNCLITLSASSFTYGCADVGTTIPVVLTADDGSNSTQCTANVTIADNTSSCNQPPTAVCQDLSVDADNNCQGIAAAPDFDDGSSDPDGDPLNFSVSPAGPYSLGVTNVILTVTSAGQSDNCSASITVTDNEQPTISCSGDVTVNNDPSECGATVFYNTTVTDNCPPQSITFTESFQNGVIPSTSQCNAWQNFLSQLTPQPYTKLTISSNLNAGVFTTDPAVIAAVANALNSGTTVSISDGSNTWGVAQSGCGSEIHVNQPLCNCGFDYAVRPCISNANWGGVDGPTCSAPDQTITVSFEIGTTISQTSGLPSGSQFPVGTTTNTFVATDADGNNATCTQTVTVIDNEKPSITCPGPLTVKTDPGDCNATNVVLGTPTFADNCPGATVSNDAPFIFNIGNTTVTWTVTDAAGNKETCTQTVTVVDNEKPTITCPGPVTVKTDPGDCNATNVILGTPTFADNCPGATVSNDAPFIFNIGNTTVTWTVTDAAGNKETCTQSVTVV
ncbi:MAG: HYR domain-containing protein, partial [Bacteroidia bacterium]|nr:HYR domain-containing protein [Bacteroidia bacterium]